MGAEESKIESVFYAAMEKDSAAARAVYLDEACADDPELRGRVELLLDAQPKLGRFLENDAASVAPTLVQPLAERPGMMIGRYKLVHEIGHGGMGVVYMAVQKEPVKRKVALKIIKPGMDTREVVTRFEAERQALAMMDHQCIATVLDGGSTESGRPYFVMELVEGTPIGEYCDECRYTTRQRLELFVQVCQAVQHAHMKGIIHRDIKPSNILVTNYDHLAVPKVIDFGIAKAVHQPLTDQSLYTHVSQMIGTPLYMSPEQVQRTGQDVDTRTDVYSLGVLLYELLTGKTPFDKERFKASGLDEVKRIIREEEPPKPSTRLSTLGETGIALDTLAEKHHTDLRTLSRELSGELDWIVMRAMEKDRTRRYESANDLAKDIRRYLNDEAVEACPPSTAYRFRKFVRRNKTALATASVVALALVLGLAGTTWQSIRATRESERATDESIRATQESTRATLALRGEQQQRERAEANFQKAVDAVDEMLTQVADEDLADIPRMEPVRRSLLERALAFYLGFLEEEGEDPEVQQEAAKAQKRAGDILKLLGENERAERHYREAIKRFEAIPAERAQAPAAQHDLGESLIELAGLMRHLERHEEAREVCNRTLSIERKLVANFPKDAEFRRALAVVLNTSGRTLHDTGRLEEAEKAYREAIDVGRQLVAESPDAAEYRAVLAIPYVNMGNLLSKTGRHEEAEASYREAIEIRKQLAADLPQEPKYRSGLASCHNSLGVLLSKTGRQEEAEASHREAIELRKRLAADFPHVPKYRSGLAACHNNFGALLIKTGRYEEAEAAFLEALEIQKQLAADFPDVPGYRNDVASYLGNLGTLLYWTPRNEEGEAYYREALKIDKQLVADFPEVPEYRLELASRHDNLGILLRNTGRKEEAEASHQAALEVLKQLAADCPDVPLYCYRLATAHINLGSVLHKTDRKSESEAAYRAALKVGEQLAADFPDVPEHRTLLALAHNNLGLLLKSTGRKDEAEAPYRESLKIREQLVADHPEEPEHRSFLGDSYSALAYRLNDRGRKEEADVAFRKALKIREQLIADHPQVPKHREGLLSTLHGYGWNRVEERRFHEAEEIHRRALALLDELGEKKLDEPWAEWVIKTTKDLKTIADRWAKQKTEESPEDAQLRYDYAVLLAQNGEHVEAIVEFDEAIRLEPGRAAHYTERARVHVELCDPKKALEDADKAVELDPQCGEAYAARAMALTQQGEHTKAEPDWTEAVRLAPDTAWIRLGQGMAYAGIGKPDDAVESFTEAIRLDPKNALAYAERGFTYTQLGDDDKTQADWQEAMRIDPKCGDRYVQRGRHYRTGTMLDRAVVEYTKAIRLAPENWRALQERGKIHLELERFDEAIADYREAIRIKPGDGPATSGLLAAYSQQDDLDGAIAAFTELIEQAPDIYGYYDRRARAYTALEKPEQAIRDYGEAIRIGSAYAPYHYIKRADLHRGLGQYDIALADLQTAIDVALKRDCPNFKPAAVSIRRATIFLEDLQQPEKGAAEFTKAIELDPENGDLYQKRGDAYQAMGDSGGAEADYEEAKRLREEKTPDEVPSEN